MNFFIDIPFKTVDIQNTTSSVRLLIPGEALFYCDGSVKSLLIRKIK